MRSLNVAAIGMLGLTAISALAQAPPMVDSATGARPGHEPGVGISLPMSTNASNIGPRDTRSSIAPTLPDADASESADTMEFLRAARVALVAGRTGQAQQSLEMAETRALDRSVPQGQTNTPTASPFVAHIRGARLALSNHDNDKAIQLVDEALTR